MFAVFVVFEYSDIRPAALKIITPTSTSHKMASSVAFLTRPALRLLKVTHRWRSFGIFSIFIFFRPMLESCTGEGALVADQTTSSSRSFLVLECCNSKSCGNIDGFDSEAKNVKGSSAK